MSNPVSSQSWVDGGSNLLVGCFECSQSSLDDGSTIWNGKSKLDLGPATESLLPGAIGHLKRYAHAMEARMHRFMENRGSDLRFGEVAIDREREFDQAGVLVG